MGAFRRTFLNRETGKFQSRIQIPLPVLVIFSQLSQGLCPERIFAPGKFGEDANARAVAPGFLFQPANFPKRRGNGRR